MDQNKVKCGMGFILTLFGIFLGFVSPVKNHPVFFALFFSLFCIIFGLMLISHCITQIAVANKFLEIKEKIDGVVQTSYSELNNEFKRN